MMRRKLLGITVLAGVVLAGCTDTESFDDTAASAPLAPAGFDVPVSTNDGPLPAWQTAQERADAKADRFDVRGNYEDIYGVTAPPAGATRAVAEFERSDGVLVDWDGMLPEFMIELIDAIDDSAPLYVMTDSVSESNRVRRTLARNGVDVERISFFEFQNDAFWTRDYGPIPVALSDGTPAFVDARYYPDRRRDDAVPELMSRYFGVDAYRPDLATEGGNFMSNGSGLCVATEWLLQENPQLSRAQVESIKRDYFGCDDLLILERMDGEGTGHVDMFAKFLTENTVLVGSYDPLEEPRNAAILDRNAQRLENVRLADGSFLNVVRIPMPRATFPVYRSYTNSLIVNDTVVVPVYAADRRFEAQALAAYRDNLPAGYRIVTVPADDVIELGGAVHCVTMGFALASLDPANDNRPTEPTEPSEPEPSTEAQFSSSPDLLIRDNQASTDTIEVSAVGPVSELVVAVDIEHTYIGDLKVKLVWNGYEVVLHEFGGGGADGLQQSYTIEGLDGFDVNGPWSLVVEDYQEQDEGVLRNWSLEFR